MAAAENLTGGIKDLLSIQIKPRHDSMCDQYSRLFVVKLLLVCTIVIGVNQYSDTLSCIIPESLGICSGDDEPESSCNFIHAACWIQGMYVYKQLLDRRDDIAYYGMPMNIDKDGYLEGTNDLCNLEPRLEVPPNPNCVPMTKTFFLQYQWMAFFLGALTLLYYLPYVVFCKVNDDMISLRTSMKLDDIPKEQILESYFKRDSATRIHARLRIFLNLMVKVLYVGANVISFLALDKVLNGEFWYYGKKWIDWSSLNNTVMYDYMGRRDYPKPGNRLLPPFGYCEFYESARDIKITKANKIKVVCEISPHILYQYSLLVLWFAVVIGIAISALGLIHLAWTYVASFVIIKAKENGIGAVTLRQMEYITYIKTRDKEMYGDIVQKLKQDAV